MGIVGGSLPQRIKNRFTCGEPSRLAAEFRHRQLDDRTPA